MGMTDRQSEEAFRSAEAYFFDLDGCVYLTDRPAPGARELIEQMERDGKQVGFLTNNSRETAVEITAKLQAMGIIVQVQQIITATDAVGAYIKERYGVVSVSVAGSPALERAIALIGHTLVELADGKHADVVVVGRDTTFTFDKLQQIVDRIEAGAVLVSANPDIWHPGPGSRKVVETGALIAAIQAVTGCTPNNVGKPERFLFQYARSVFGLTTQSCAMIGDNLHTDIAGGAAAGMTTVWIATSIAWQKEVERSPQPQYSPDLRVDNLEALLSIYRQEQPPIQGGIQ